MKEKKMIYPTIHLGGTAADDLLADLSASITALTEALNKLSAAAPNARDYPLGGFSQAQAEHEQRTLAIQGVLGEMLDLADDVFEQRVTRRRQ